MQSVRSLIFSAGMIISLTIVGGMVIFCFFTPFRVRYKITRLWTRFNIWWLGITCNIHYKILGGENIPTDACIVLAKHQSTWETLFLHRQLPALAWVLKRELLKVPMFGWALALLEPIAINRSSSSAMKEILEQGTAFLKRGRWVLLFPEGTRTATGKRQRYRLGGARLAAHSGFPVLPVAHNAGEYWPRRGFLKKPGTITIVFGPLIDSAGKTPEQVNQQVEEWIEAKVAQISAKTTPTPL